MARFIAQGHPVLLWLLRVFVGVPIARCSSALSCSNALMPTERILDWDGNTENELLGTLLAVPERLYLLFAADHMQYDAIIDNPNTPTGYTVV